ncbi:MAG TPA: serine acetyltransferase [Thermoanaerobaculia bacterium]|nr:serine acetyltransferase [Thermoanaerobaculia bacterium]
MRTSLPPAELAEYVARQMEVFFPDGPVDRPRLRRGLDLALDRLATCFAGIDLKYYRRDGEPVYDHLHTDQHAALLYLLSHLLHRELGETALATKAYALNKALHGLDAFYEIELPPVFLFSHPLGSVLGRSRYGNYLVIYHQVTVGYDLDGNAPELGEGVVLFGGSRVIGRSRLGDNTWVTPGAIVMDQEFPGDSVIFGVPPATQRRPTKRDVVRDVFGRGGGG